MNVIILHSEYPQTTEVLPGIIILGPEAQNAGARNQGSALSDGRRRLRKAPQGLARTGGSGVTICT